jgi:hypothetical protein
MKTIYYYQTFVGLDKLLTHVEDIDVINISSIHFDEDKHGTKNIYLNDYLPIDKRFDDMWLDCEKCYNQGTIIMLMVGGAGGAYQNLFKHFDIYYPMLHQLLKEKTFVQGIDLDIEEGVSLDKIKMLMRRLKADFGNSFKLTMAPVAPSLMHDGSSMAGFSYKELFSSEEGKFIEWFNTQCYGSFSKETYDLIIRNGYPPQKIVMGMESGQFNKHNFNNALSEVKKILEDYPKMCGVFDWEYFDAPPDDHDPSLWCKLMKHLS